MGSSRARARAGAGSGVINRESCGKYNSEYNGVYNKEYDVDTILCQNDNINVPIDEENELISAVKIVKTSKHPHGNLIYQNIRTKGEKILVYFYQTIISTNWPTPSSIHRG